MVLVPSFVRIDGVVFPLGADARGVWLDVTEPELNALDLLLTGAIARSPGATRTAELRARDSLSLPHRAASPVTLDTPLDVLGDGPINWKRLSGAWPDRADAYLIGASGVERQLVIPTATLIALIEQVGALHDDVLAGRREPRVDAAMAVPPRPPPAADVLEHERLRPFTERAQRVLEELLALPADHVWAPPPDEPDEPDEPDDEARAQAAADRAAQAPSLSELMARPTPRAEPTALAQPEILRELERAARAVDELDARARQGAEPYADETLDATLVAKRQRLLLELDVAGVFAPALAEAAHAQLRALDLPTLRGYRDAAVAMRAYFASPARARLVRKPAPAHVIDADISLDWFRQPSGYCPSTCTPDEWLALCERNFEQPPAMRAGRLFLKLEGAYHQLWVRSELGATPRLWRALPM